MDAALINFNPNPHPPRFPYTNLGFHIYICLDPGDFDSEP